jgi:cyclase
MTNRNPRHRFRIPILLALTLAAATAAAQRDISGPWRAIYHEDFPERIPGPDLVEYQGLPINDAARRRGLSWDASMLSMPVHQCRPHPADYGSRHSNFRILAEYDSDTQQLIAYHSRREWQAVERTIYMDGRPHPSPNASHTWQGFSTGEWEGDKLKVTTTHLKAGYVRRNGLPRSDLATLTEYYYRTAPGLLTVVKIVDDPVYLTEPLIQTSDYRTDFTLRIDPYPCDIVEEVVGRPDSYVPHLLPDRHPSLNEFAERYGLPMSAVLGGAETMYPGSVEQRSSGAISSGAGGFLSRHDTRSARALGAFRERAASPPDEIDILHVQGNVYLLAGPDGNTAVQAGPDGVLIVDTQSAESGEKLLAAIRTLTEGPIRYVVNTHAHSGHIGGNEVLMAAGSTIAGGNVAREIGDAGRGAKGIAHENVLLRLASRDIELPYSAWPTDYFVQRPKELWFNGESVRILHQPAAHTDGDSIVHFRRSDVIVAGDVLLTTTYPVIDVERGGSIEGIIDALNRILELAIPQDRQEGGTLIVPGHGRISDEADVVEYRDMLTIIRDRIRHLMNEGMSLAEVQRTQPTADYDPRYAAVEGAATAARFVAAVYHSLGNGEAQR